jgi:hypothetical protein
MQRRQAIILRERRRELGGRDHRLLILFRLGYDDPRRPTRNGALQQPTVFNRRKSITGAVTLDVLRA